MQSDNQTHQEDYLPQSILYSRDGSEEFYVNSQALLIGNLAQDLIKTGAITPIEWLKWIPLGQQTDLFSESRIQEKNNYITYLICQPTKTNILIAQQAVDALATDTLLKVAIFIGHPTSETLAMQQLESAVDCFFYVDRQQKAPQITREIEHILRGIGDLYNYQNLVGVDFEDVRTIMQKSGLAHIRYSPPNVLLHQISELTQQALNELHAENTNHQPISGMIALLHHGTEFKMKHLVIMMEIIRHSLGDETEILFSDVMRENWTEECQITIASFGLSEEARKRAEPFRTASEPSASEDKLDTLDIPPYLRRQLSDD
ncbi:hypothetical protein LIN78_03680 [Leeia sp. TBRC 13508]|uniref:Uncharacterized protein n=1 Tax=Leeia speluncae TaxID=2884804 RepID=A0ABS8D3B5_9NEIS|nr:hypothetical protein [Leeia speluncae]MCB6182652.1 hypothetical protein [Leeia speluncae]